MLVGGLGCGLTDGRLVQMSDCGLNEMDYGRWNKWDGQWTEGNKMKHDQRCVDWKAWDEIWIIM